jgi:hypothetical protein
MAQMKVLLFITGFRQVKEYDYFARFLRRLNTLNSICDVFVYCNNPLISEEIITYYRGFTQANKQLLVTSVNAGFTMGAVEAVSRAHDMGVFEDYDYVIHLHPDVFLTDEGGILDLLNDNADSDCVFFITRSVPDDERFFSFDFFIFKPKLLKQNIFSEELHGYGDIPEHFLCDMLVKHEIEFRIVKRFDNDSWLPRRIDDHLKLYHEHDLGLVRALLSRLPDRVEPSRGGSPRPGTPPWEPPVVALRPPPVAKRTG